MSSSIPSVQTAALIKNPGDDAQIVFRSDIPVGNPGVNEILVKLAFTGVCGSEIRALSGWGPYNSIVGHEGVGTVVKHGEGVDTSMLNKRVGVKWLYSACGACNACERGYPNNCPKQLNTGRHVAGTLQEYMIADARYVTEIPDGLPGEVAAPLLCAGLTMAGGVSKLAGYAVKGDWIVISGSGGGLGHLGIQIAARLYGLRVIAIDTGEARRQLSLDSGAEHFIDFAVEDVEARVKGITDEGASAVLVVTGSQEAFIQAPSLVRNMGIIVNIGLPRNDFNIPLSATICSARSLTVTGVAVGTEEQMKELLQHALERTIVPEVKVLEFGEPREELLVAATSKMLNRLKRPWSCLYKVLDISIPVRRLLAFLGVFADVEIPLFHDADYSCLAVADEIIQLQETEVFGLGFVLDDVQVFQLEELLHEGVPLFFVELSPVVGVTLQRVREVDDDQLGVFLGEFVDSRNDAGDRFTPTANLAGVMPCPELSARVLRSDVKVSRAMSKLSLHTSRLAKHIGINDATRNIAVRDSRHARVVGAQNADLRQRPLTKRLSVLLHPVHWRVGRVEVPLRSGEHKRDAAIVAPSELDL
ncbi:hypothetical protein HG530_002745 [Fusarium avenaceum]|nr:hypothetical protein HG530_002745 [Fusarium avenaceum]